AIGAGRTTRALGGSRLEPASVVCAGRCSADGGDLGVHRGLGIPAEHDRAESRRPVAPDLLGDLDSAARSWSGGRRPQPPGYTQYAAAIPRVDRIAGGVRR